MYYNLDIGLTFSSGEPYNDYEAMADAQFGSTWESHDALDRMWEDGSVDEDALC